MLPPHETWSTHKSEASSFLRILRPVANIDDPFKALVFDSNFDHYRGVVANIAVLGGRVRKGDRIVSAHLGKSYEVNELGLLRPDEHPTQKLYASSSSSLRLSHPLQRMCSKNDLLLF